MSWKMNTTFFRHGETASLINADGTLNVEDNVEYVLYVYILLMRRLAYRGILQQVQA